MDWSTRRKITYTSIVVLLVAIYSLYYFRDTISPLPTCFDGKANGIESGIDCGGDCRLMCQKDVKPLIVEWTSFIKTNDKTYDLVAFISNKNTSSGATSTQYFFNLINKDGKTLFEKKGEMVTPINSSFPIILQNVVVRDIPTKLIVSLSKDKQFKIDPNANKSLVKVVSKSIEVNEDISRVYAKIENLTLDTLLNLKVKVILFDENKNTVGVGETVIGKIEGEEVKDIILTWKTPFEREPVLVEIYPLIDPFTLNMK